MADEEIEPQDTADMADSLSPPVAPDPDLAPEPPAPSPPPSVEETDAFASHPAPQPPSDGLSKRQRRPNVRLNEIGDGPLANVVGYFLKRKGAARTTKPPPPSTPVPSSVSGKPSKRPKIFHKLRDAEDEGLEEREEEEEVVPHKPFTKRSLNSKRKSGLSKVPYSKANLSKKQHQQVNTRPHHRPEARPVHISEPGITIRPLHHHPEARSNARPHQHLEDGFGEAADGGVYGCSDTDKQARSQSPPPNYDDAHPAGSSFESDSPKRLQKNPPAKQNKKKVSTAGHRMPSAGYAAKDDAEEKEEPSSSDVQEMRMQIPSWERGLPTLDDKVRDWMKSIGLEKYAPVFQHHEVTNDVLPLLTMDDLKEMGISAVGARRKLFTEIVKLRQALMLVDETLSDGK